MQKVTVGFKGFREVNTVTYDAKLITPGRMVKALQAAGTYIGTVEE